MSNGSVFPLRTFVLPFVIPLSESIGNHAGLIGGYRNLLPWVFSARTTPSPRHLREKSPKLDQISVFYFPHLVDFYPNST